MISPIKFINKIRAKKLSAAVEESKLIMQKYRDENIFKSKTLNELMSDTFTYKGNKPNTILVKNKKTGEPVELNVQFIYPTSRNRQRKEKYIFSSKDDKNVADKDFYFIRDINRTLKIEWGSMENYRRDTYSGVGVKLNQIEIERALQNNIEKIPIHSVPDALLFHTMMGFLPSEGRLVAVKCINSAKRYVKKYAREFKNDIEQKHYKPIIIERNGKYFIDLNKTQANANMSQIKEDISKNKASDIMSRYVSLELSGKELEHWKELIKGHEVTKNFNFNFPKY